MKEIPLDKESYVVPKGYCASCGRPNPTKVMNYTWFRFFFLVIFWRLKRQGFQFPVCEECDRVFTKRKVWAWIYSLLLLGSLGYLIISLSNMTNFVFFLYAGMFVIFNLVTPIRMVAMTLAGWQLKIFNKSFHPITVVKDISDFWVFRFGNNEYGGLFGLANYPSGNIPKRPGIFD